MTSDAERHIINQGTAEIGRLAQRRRDQIIEQLQHKRGWASYNVCDASDIVEVLALQAELQALRPR